MAGTATFTEIDDGVHAKIEIQYASPGLHATHLHLGSCYDIGPHWHLMGIPAGTVSVPVAEATLEKQPIGVGEIGNIPVRKDGPGILEFSTPFWAVGGDPNTEYPRQTDSYPRNRRYLPNKSACTQYYRNAYP